MNDLSSITCDDTYYESDVRYLTDIRLLWEAVDWSYTQLKSLSKQAGRRTMRTKKIKWTKRYVNYSKMRRKDKKEGKTFNPRLTKPSKEDKWRTVRIRNFRGL